MIPHLGLKATDGVFRFEFFLLFFLPGLAIAKSRHSQGDKFFNYPISYSHFFAQGGVQWLVGAWRVTERAVVLLYDNLLPLLCLLAS
jgi:hypothetical protein